jgi:NAD(P)-dependent dehydrogenase (short-subunit alcohol dehydrogenase family)
MTNALITGGAGGLGQVVARQLRDAGHLVAVTDIDAGAVHAMRQEGFLAELIDSGTHDALADFFDRFERDHAPFEIVVNNVGIAAAAGPIEALELAAWQTAIEVNLLGAVATMRRAIPAMKQNRRGVIVNVSTASVRTRPVHRSPYIVTKAALEALTTAVAREVAPFQIRCNAVRPAMMDNARLTRVLQAAADRAGLSLAEIEADALKYVGMGCKVKMQEVADCIVFLAGDGAASITGQIIEVDGGLVFEP